jgi:hypothetical protein
VTIKQAHSVGPSQNYYHKSRNRVTEPWLGIYVDDMNCAYDVLCKNIARKALMEIIDFDYLLIIHTNSHLVNLARVSFSSSNIMFRCL